MKNYATDIGMSKDFILNYEVEGDMIKVKFADGRKHIIPSTRENEMELLEKMKKQVLSASDYYKLCKRNIKLASFCIIYLLLASSWVSGFSAVLLSLFMGVEILSLVTIVLRLKDYKKNILFLENETKLNESIKSNQNVLANANDKVLEMVKSTPEEREVFTLNSIDKMSIGELKRLLEVIRKDEEFDFDKFKAEEIPKKLGRSR